MVRHAFLKQLLMLWGKLRMRWRVGVPLRLTMMVVVMVGVTTPALILLTLEQELAAKSQKSLLAQNETALLRIGASSLDDPLWAMNHTGLDAAANRLLESPQVVALRIEKVGEAVPVLHRMRAGYIRDLDKEVQGLPVTLRSQTIVHDGQALGTLQVWFDANFGRSLLQERRTQMLVLVALQVLASLIVLAPVLVSRVLQPIERLKEQASALLAHKGQGDSQVFIWHRHDELGLLGRHLSRVQDELKTLFRELAAKNAQLEQLAFYDQLTALPNRGLFHDLVQREMLQARRSQQRFGLFFIDLDRFKAVNDTLGHPAGDALLIEIARRLREVLREVDVVCRQSGDEFLVLLRDIAHWQSLGEMAQRVLQVVEAPVWVGNGTARVSASIGIAMFPDDGEDFETLVKHADIAVYQAKSLGRARYSFYHAELNTRLQATLELEQQLGHAIEAGELVLHYQPQVDANTGQLVGVEALVRWQHPKKGLLYPAQFIAMAEESGKIADMGVWALREACRQRAAWKARGLDVGCMAVNVSALEFRDHRLLDSLRLALQSSGLQAQDLEIEITESVLMAETETSQRIIQGMRELGVGIAIDDFGTGYSSLAYLKRLRPTQLKIDRSFVHDTDSDVDSRAIIRGIMGLADALGLRVVAEGVETAQQVRFLRDSGCQILQGYFLARPLPVDEFEVWMRSRSWINSLFAPL
jgi:diguanylate cyclase